MMMCAVRCTISEILLRYYILERAFAEEYGEIRNYENG